MSQATAGIGQTPSNPSLTVRALDGVSTLAERVPQGACRFLVAGGIASLINWLVRFPLSLALPYGPAVAVAYGVGMVAGFGLYRSWVFPGSSLPLGAQILRFILVNAAGLTAVVTGSHGLVALIAGTGLAGLPIAEAVGHGGAIVLGAVVNFLGHRAVTFTRSALASRVAAERGSR